MGIEDVVDGKMEEAPAIETPPIEAPATEEAPAPEVAEVETPELPEAVTPEPVKEDKTIPLATALDWRDRFTAAERKLAEIEAAKSLEPAKVPDPYDDPKGYDASVRAAIDQKVTANKFEMSNVIAQQTHGKEVVDEATAWALDRAKTDPGFAQKYMSEAHPIDWIVRQRKEAADLDEYRTDPVAFARKLLEANGQAVSPVPVLVAGEQQQAPVTPPRSLASTPSKHGGVKDVPTGPLSALTELFAGR